MTKILDRSSEARDNLLVARYRISLCKSNEDGNIKHQASRRDGCDEQRGWEIKGSRVVGCEVRNNMYSS
jgi:hypothetical protein